MTQFFPFAPQPRSAFVFQPVLDGQTTTAAVTWNIGGLRWYVSVYDLDGTRIFTLPMVGSSDPAATASASWDSLRQRTVAATVAPHGIEVGTSAVLTFAGFAPGAYCGTFECAVLDPYTLAYPTTTDPGAVVTLGTVCAEVDLCGGYFTSRMVFRTSAQRFEVTP